VISEEEAWKVILFIRTFAGVWRNLVMITL